LRKLKKYIILLIALAQLNTLTAQKKRLGLNLTKGQTYYQNMVANSTISQDVNGQKMIINASIFGTLAFNVTAIIDSIYSIDVQYEKLSMSMKMQNGSVDFNSEKNDVKDIFSTLLGALKNRPFYIKMNRVGKIKEVKNIDSIFINMFDKFPQLSEVQRQQIQGQLMQAYGEKAFKSSFEMVTAIFPDLPVQNGSTWVIKSQLESGMAANVVTTYELKESGEAYNMIIGNATIETADKDAYIQTNGMPLKYNLTGTMTSTIKIDKKTGWVIDSKTIQVMSGTAEIKDNPKMPGGMIIPMKSETEMTITSN
jgi:hypothetical protein